jgi:hypothetical protein
MQYNCLTDLNTPSLHLPANVATVELTVLIFDSGQNFRLKPFFSQWTKD